MADDPESLEVKLLKDLKVPELRAELEKRELGTSGLKKALVERLSKQLEAEGHDPTTYDFNQADVEKDAEETVNVSSTEISLKDLDKDDTVNEEESKEEASINDDEKKDESDKTADDDEPMEEKVTEDVESDQNGCVKLNEINENKNDEEEKMDTKESNATETEEETADSSLVSGTVVQFNSKKVIFEFNFKEETCIGEVKVDILKHDSRGKVIPAEITDGDIGNHITAGDEVRCHVIEKDDIEPFTYEQISEECGENDETVETKTETVIQPKWLAIKGHIVTEDESKKNDLNGEGLLALNDQLEEQFDYEPEDEEEEEDMLLIEDVHIDDTPRSERSKAASKNDDLEIVDMVSGNKKSPSKPMPASKKKEALREAADDDSDVEPEETFEHKARLFQLRKPSSTTSGSATATHKPDVGKVTSCILELLDGKHAGKQINAVSMSMYMWGYNLAKANLNSAIKVGDHCQVEYKVQPKKEKDEFVDDLLVVKNTWIGPKTEKPIRPSSDKNFSVYLSGRGMNETDFLKWVYGQSLNRPYFPFASDIYEGELDSYMRDTATGQIMGVILTNVTKQLNFNNGSYTKAVISEEVKNDEAVEETKVEKEVPPGTEEEPTPPGMEVTALTNKSAKELLGMSSLKPPAEQSEWAPLHYLQDAIISKSKMAFEEDKIKFATKEKEFPFNEPTNFQASDKTTKEDATNWKSSAPFYNIGTLAFLMHCKGLKYAAYIQRTLANAHVQYVKKEDVVAVFQYLNGKGESAPNNIRRTEEMKEKQKEANSEFFNDRTEDYVDEEGFVIPTDEVKKIESVVAFTSDFYVGGVSIGKIDLRLFLKVGDKVCVQVNDMSSAEKRRIKKVLGPDAPTIPSYMATLAYFGSEKRPKSANVTPVTSPDLKEYLNKTGWALEEFAALRQFGMQPPQEFQMDTAGELAVKINDFPNATRLAKEAMQIPTIEGNDSFIDQILRDDDDVRVAVWMTKVLTKALTNKLQANLKAKLASNFFNTAMEKREIDSQVAKIAAAETALISSKDSNSRPKNGVAPDSSTDTSMIKPASQLKELEEQERKKSEASLQELNKKSNAPKRDAKALLKSYKDTTGNGTTKAPPKKMYTLMSDIRKGLPSNKDEWTPLEYLRHFATEGKEIKTDFNHIVFGPVKFLKSTKCNFRNNKDDSHPWYSLDQLYICYKFRDLKHGTYLEELKRKYGPKMSRDLFLYHRDRDALIKYLQGGSAPEQVCRRTRRDLNPEQFADDQPDRKRARMSPPRSADDLERERKAQLQLQLLNSQQNTGRPQIIVGPDGKPAIEMMPSQGSRPKDRFDLASGLLASARGAPGMVVADHRPSKPNPYDNSRSSDPYGYDPRQRSRSPAMRGSSHDRYSSERGRGDPYAGDRPSSYRDRERDFDSRDRRPYDRAGPEYGSSYDRPSPPRNDPYARGISPPRMDYGRGGISPPRMSPGRGISPPRANYGRGISPPRMDSSRGIILMDNARGSRSPPRYGGAPPSQGRRSPPRRSNSPGVGYFLGLPQPKPKPNVESDLEKHWRDQMSSIGRNKPPLSQGQSAGRPQRPYDDDLERRAHEEAMAEQRRLMAAMGGHHSQRNMQPDVVELSDSDDDGSNMRRPRGPPGGPPMPPMISQPPSWGAQRPPQQQFYGSGNPLQRAMDRERYDEYGGGSYRY